MTYRKSMSDAIREVQEATIKPYVSMSMGGQYNVLDKDGKVAYSTRDKTLAYDYFKKNFDKLKEDGDHEVSMAIGQLKTISQYAEKMQTILQSKGNDYDIEAWVQSKITSAEDYMNSVAHYMENDPSVNEEVNEVSDKLKLAVLKKKIKQYKDKVFKKTMSTIKSPLFAGDEIEEGRMKDIFTADQEGKSAEEIAKLMKLPLNTVKSILGEEVYQDIAEFTSDMIKRLQKSYSTMPKTISPEQAKALSKHLDRLDLASLKQLTKAKIPFVTTLARNKVYKKTGKFEEIEEQSSSEIMNKAKEFGVTAKMTSQGIDISGFKTQAGMDKFMKYIASQGKNMINLAKMGMKRNFEVKEEVEYPHKMYDPKSGKEVEAKTPEDHEKYAKMGYTHDKPKEEVKDTEKKESENKDNTIASLKDQIAMLKTKLENEKNRAIKPEPNPETGEVPLTVGVAYKHFKDKKEKEVKEDVSEKAMTDREKRIQRAKDMIKYYDAQKKAALKGKNKDLAKKMLKNDIEETVSIKAYKNAVDPSKKGLEISKTGGMSGMIVIKDKKELKDLETKLAQAKRLYNIKEMKNDLNEVRIMVDLNVGYKNVNSEDEVEVVIDVPSNRLTDDDYVETRAIDRAEELLKQRKIGPRNVRSLDYMSTEMLDFNKTTKPLSHYSATQVSQKDPSIKEADLTKSQIKQVHKVADDLPKKDFKDRYGKEKGDAVRFGTATNMVKKKLGMKEDRRLYVETIAGLKKKAEKSGMPYSILKKVYDRGMAAWKSGHRPGASQQQWAFARVNSFVTKSSGTWGGADKDLAKQVKG